MGEVKVPTVTAMTQNYAESAAYAAVRKFKAEIRDGADPEDAQQIAVNQAIGMVESSGSDYEIAAEALEIEAEIARYLSESLRDITPESDE